ncbi:MAG: hypothetical protein CL610_09290 [Anaerolineaceae bacterium]|nr:hypothetical protein [Anaerolineaceae bacterium]
MTQSVEQVLAQAVFYSDDQLYDLIQLPAKAIMAAAGVMAEIGEPFGALIVDKDEVSLIIPAEAWDDFQGRLPGSQAGSTQYRLITFDVVLEPDLVGFMALISRALADAQISILTYAAFSRDHFLVPVDQFNLALQALETLKSQYSSSTST